MEITAEQIHLLAPNAHTVYKEAFASCQPALDRFDVTTPLRLAHFMAQVLHETAGLTILVESMNYRAERIVQVWPSRFKTVRAAQPYAHNPAKLANKVYGGRMGNTEADDGWRFIGRGLLQITGRESYARYGNQLSIDLTGHPELAISAEESLPIGLAEWTFCGCNAFADEDNLKRITRAINGGYIGLTSRADWLAKTKHVWCT